MTEMWVLQERRSRDWVLYGLLILLHCSIAWWVYRVKILFERVLSPSKARAPDDVDYKCAYTKHKKAS